MTWAQVADRALWAAVLIALLIATTKITKD